MATRLCPSFIANGSCVNSTCQLSHTAYPCEVCRMSFPNLSLLSNHLRTKAHTDRVNRSASGTNRWGFCELCNLNVALSVWEVHIQSRRHRGLASTTDVAPDTIEPQLPRSDHKHTLCEVCDVLILAGQHKQAIHEQSLAHRNGLAFAALKSVLSEAAEDRNGMTMSHEDGIDFGVVEVADAILGRRIEVVVEISMPSRLRLVKVNIAGVRSGAESFTVDTSGDVPQNLITVILKQSMTGQYEDRLEVTFENPALRRQFLVIRAITATIIGTREVYELLKPAAPYIQKPRSVKREHESEVVRGIPPKVPPSLTKHARKLPEYPIPQPLKAILSHTVEDIIKEIQSSYLPNAPLNGETYGQFWRTLLWAEEHRAELDLQIFDLDDALLEKKRQGVLYWLRVPGLAEKRPSVIRDDRINVRPVGSKGKWFEGRVHEVHESKVGMRFSTKFAPPSATQRFDVRFKFNRIPVRRQHQALEQTRYRSDRVLFPAQTHWPKAPKRLIRREEVTLYNANIAGNGPQLDAVMAVLNLPEGAPPFVLFGPPGTGKTVTLVEAALQVVTLFPNYRLLMTAPSNSAADLITQRLSARLGQDLLFRLNSRSRRVQDMPASLLPYSLVNGNELDIPTLEKLMTYRIVVCTSVSAAVPYTLGVPPGHFHGIFVDEAGQATEPEVMIAIKDLADDRTNVVLAGDPKQLGPVVRSAIARELGLSKSYLERLMDINMYEPHAGHGKTVVKLVKNYRSHEAILTFPNARFYDGELVTCAPDEKRNACINASVLVNKKYPLVFHSISGTNERESTSPSYFNILEAEQVKRYIDELVADKRVNVRYEDIGVIAPYHAQVLKVRKLLREKGKEGATAIKVGSVEEFQGQERKVIFVSTVRSSRDLVEFDLRHTLGFVSNARRFNVAVTRAQALLIIVGDPDVLSLDPLWRSFLNVVHENGGWRGPPIPWDPTEEVREDGGYDAEARDRGAAELNELANRLHAMNVGEEDEAAADRVIIEED
ncbi:P-loop containing nucleoside triphosphate hydrolase protein [Peniophora sp. CONT]|nr:P-loop containing nucleoside triphosphate hydrolase protein [Peniophora sp. CONT]